MTEKTLFRLGTRGSPLALWQAYRVRDLLSAIKSDVTIEIEIIQTVGDKILDKPLVQLGDKGVFTKEIEKALLEKTIDFAVHSFKDLPTVLPEGLEILCIPERESPFDVLISNSASSLKDLPENPVVATGSLRRKAQILSCRPDTTVVDIRGNINTRMKKFHDSDWDGMIMAEAGIKRMEWTDKIAGVLSIDEMIPAPAQGALAVEGRIDDHDTKELLSLIHDHENSLSILAERSFLAELEGGCQVPIASHAVVNGDQIELTGLIASLDGTNIIRETNSFPSSAPILAGQTLAKTVLEKGGHKIINTLKSLNSIS
jgi:hydroxymethylbilane synthase